MSTDKVEVEYEFHNNTVFVQVEFGLEDKDVEEMEGLTLSHLGGPLGGLLESIVHKSAYSGPINMILSAKWPCYVLPIHVACSIMQIGPLVPKLQQVTGLHGR